MRKLFWLAIALLLFLWSCDSSSSSDIDKEDIRTAISDIQSAFYVQDIGKIMECYHPNYLHDGITKAQEREYWLDQIALNKFDHIVVHNIELHGAYATVKYSTWWNQSGEQVEIQEPQYGRGNLSYWFNEDGTWQLFGDQDRGK